MTVHPEKNVKASEDYLHLMLHAHVIAAAKLLMSQKDFNNIRDLAVAIVDAYVSLPRSDDSTVLQACPDGVQLYASEVLSLGLLWFGYHDAIREGDGDRILNYWKFLLVLFKSTSHANYAKEAVNLLLQYYYKFSERQKAQLLWSRCINTRGLIGCNLPCDLHMEHLNRRIKKIIHSMGANVNPKAIVKAGKALGPVEHICQLFEEQTSNNTVYNSHPVPSFGKDLSTVVQVLQDEKVFVLTPGRSHKSFNANCPLMKKLSRKELARKIQKTIDQLQLV